MAIPHFSLLFLLLLISSKPTTAIPSPYLSAATLFPNYQKMLNSFKIFIYTSDQPLSFQSPSESLFHSSLLLSPFLTQNPDQAHLFFVPFPSNFTSRAVVRVIRNLRMDFPYWNRTLGADHFYLSCNGIGYESDRNLVELKKNSIQISCFPSPAGKFIPHKDISLPPHAPHAPGNNLIDDSDFVVNSGMLYKLTNRKTGRVPTGKFCLFEYGGDMSWIGDALRFGCVPVVVTDRPIHDLPFMDVLKWQEIAVFGRTRSGVRSVVDRARTDDYERMRRLGEEASQHLMWYPSPEPYDAFHTVLYQLWLRRHTIRYARWESI